jgi:hypothetical protein
MHPNDIEFLGLWPEAGAEQVHPLDLVVTDVAEGMLLDDVPAVLVRAEAIVDAESVLGLMDVGGQQDQLIGVAEPST